MPRGNLLYREGYEYNNADLWTVSSTTPWAVTKNTPTTVDILTLNGRMKTTGVATTGYADYGQGLLLTRLPDFEMRCDFQFLNTAEQYIAFGFRRSSASNSIQLNSPQDGYYVELDHGGANQIHVVSAVAGAQGAIADVNGVVFANATWYTAIVRCVGPRLMIKVFAVGAEPASWQVDQPDRTHWLPTGREYVSVGVLGGASVGVDCLFRNFSLHRFYEGDLLGLLETPSTTAATNVAAGTTDGAGAALQPTITRTGTPAAGTTAGAGAAPQPGMLIKPSAGTTDGAGSAPQPTITRTGTPQAGTTSGDGRALMPGVSATLTAGTTAGAGAAPQPTITRSVAPGAGPTAGTGATPQPTITVAVSPGAPAAAGSAPQPTVTRTGTPQAGHAAAAGAALQPGTTRTGTAPAGQPGATGAALGPTGSVQVSPSVPAGAGAAPQPTVSTASLVNVPAGLAGAAGSAPQPTSVQATSSPAGLAGAAGSAPQPTVSTAAMTNVTPGVAASSGQAFGPSLSVKPSAGHAAGGGAAPGPTVLVVNLAAAGLAAAAGAAPRPSVSVRLSAGFAAASGAGITAAVSTNTPPVELDPVALALEQWAIATRAEPWSVAAVAEPWSVTAIVEDDVMRAGDTAFPLMIRATFADPASGDLGTALVSPGITYTVTMELVGADHDTDVPPVLAQPMTVFANDGTTVTLTRAWASPVETAAPGRYSLTVTAHVGADTFRFPSDGRRCELLIEP